MAGISTRPPKQSHVAMPVSSHTRYRTLGASFGAVGAAYGPQSASESRTSSSSSCPRPGGRWFAVSATTAPRTYTRNVSGG
jgi:hypothetical protein